MLRPTVNSISLVFESTQLRTNFGCLYSNGKSRVFSQAASANVEAIIMYISFFIFVNEMYFVNSYFSSSKYGFFITNFSVSVTSEIEPRIPSPFFTFVFTKVGSANGLPSFSLYRSNDFKYW